MANEACRAGATYRALTIGVSTFAGPYDPLRYAAGLADELRAELAHLGYACGDPVATDWTSEALGTAVRDAIRAATDDDVLIVHVLTHGDVGDATRKLYVIGTDGSRHDLADVEGWLTMVQDGVRPPLVLFVLDICEAGLAARLPWQGATADGTSRAWVIAACGPQEQDFHGWLTRATTTVLRRLRAGDLDIDAGVEFVPYLKIAQEIRIEVRQLAQTAENGLRQQVTGTLLDSTVADPYLPFFRNPAFTPNPLRSCAGARPRARLVYRRHRRIRDPEQPAGLGQRVGGVGQRRGGPTGRHGPQRPALGRPYPRPRAHHGGTGRRLLQRSHRRTQRAGPLDAGLPVDAGRRAAHPLRGHGRPRRGQVGPPRRTRLRCAPEATGRHSSAAGASLPRPQG